MTSTLAIARYTIIEQIRNRLYQIILFFGGVILFVSLLLGALAPGHRTRVVFDLGLLSLELFGLTAAVFGAVNLVLQEIESKTLYLLLTRPLRRSTYIMGRFFGLMGAITLTMAAMALLHVLIMLIYFQDFKEFTSELSFWTVYPTLIFMSLGKMLITAAVAIFFSLFATSSVSALVFTGSFWIAGHFGRELAFMIDRAVQGPLRYVVHAVAAVLPDYQYFNFRDSFALPGFPGYGFIGWAVLYGLAYSGFFLIVSTILFSRKEF
ncbi:MAG: hypothetical protein LHV69_07960 [Elusimicrobia bacterium]|nr:hypothetical protein [Candidatus Obscuribacterium magneticum]